MARCHATTLRGGRQDQVLPEMVERSEQHQNTRDTRDFFELINEYPITSLIVAFFVISIIQILKNGSDYYDNMY